MPRNSEITRHGLERRVVELAAIEGSTAPMIAEMVSKECGHDISTSMVHRHLQKGALNATVNPGEYRGLEMLAAAIAGVPSVRDSADSGTTYFGRFKLDTSNVFDGYYGIARGIKSGQVMRGFKNIALKITSGARIVGDERDAEKIDDLTTEINFSSLLQDVVRSTCEMGTCVVDFKSTDGEYTVPRILPMGYITLLTDRETIGSIDSSLRIHGTVTQIVYDEGGANQIPYKRADMGLFRLWADGNEFTDIKGRNTFGIYGESMTIGVETPLKSLLNASYYYDEFIKRYGLGRLHINLKLLADMIKDQTVNKDQAQVAQDEDTAALQKIGPNEDIISAGREVSMIESKTGFDIMPYLEWRRKQIDRALLQSDVGAGDVGSSWTSAGTAVSAQDYDTYKSLRETLFRTFMEEIIIPRLPDLGLDPKTVSITATPFLRVDVPYRDLVEMADRGIITESELRDRAGFPAIKPDEV